MRDEGPMVLGTIREVKVGVVPAKASHSHHVGV